MPSPNEREELERELPIIHIVDNLKKKGYLAEGVSPMEVARFIQDGFIVWLRDKGIIIRVSGTVTAEEQLAERLPEMKEVLFQEMADELFKEVMQSEVPVITRVADQNAFSMEEVYEAQLEIFDPRRYPSNRED